MQYDSPISTAEFKDFLTTASFSDDTAAAISSLLALDTVEAVNVASWDGVNAPAGQTGNTDFVIGTIEGRPADLVTLDIPESLNTAKAFVLDSQANLNVTFDAPVAAETAPVAQARMAVLATDEAVQATGATEAAATAEEGIQFLVTTGSGDDIITVNGDQNTYIDAGAGNDTIVTGNGNNVVVAGDGNNNVTTGSGNDTIILSGSAHADVVNAGAGYDVVQLDGSRDDYQLTAGNNFNVNLTGNQTAAISNAEFLIFNNEDGDIDTIALAQNNTEAAALRLYQGILGRDADATGANQWSTEANNGTSLASIAENFLKSGEYNAATNTKFVSGLYTALLGRDVGEDTAGLQGWLSVLTNGGSKADIVSGIATSQEAIQHDSSNGEFISALYETALGREAEQAGLDSWVSQLVNGASRAEVAASILASAEASEKANLDFVTSLYVNALGRTEEQVAADTAGTSTWTDALASGASHADVALGIIGSQEAVDHIDNVVVLHGNV